VKQVVVDRQLECGLDISAWAAESGGLVAVLLYSDDAVGESRGRGDGGEEVGSFPRGGVFEEVAEHDESACQWY
jgi:hypothetical protein